MVERGTTTFREGQFSKLQAALFIRAVYLLGQLPPIVDDSKPKIILIDLSLDTAHEKVILPHSDGIRTNVLKYS